MNEDKPIITILGPTATGKTHVAVRLTAEFGGEIVSADSRQVYRRMDIGTGKDIREYEYNGAPVPYHLIDIVEPGVKYNVFQYQQAAFRAIQDIQQRDKQVVLCGGSGMYIEAVLQGYRFKFQDEGQIFSDPVNSILFGLRGDRDLIRTRITQRLEARLQEGMVEEIQSLLNEGVEAEKLIRYGLEYKFVTLYLLGEISYDEMFTQLNTAIHQFSKRQMTWFRRMERLSFDIHWIDIALSEDDKMQEIYKVLHR
ncbi:MAG: tRNA (adenosine(37)-N6)-dimethylallyltransferase MiaA [Bacteroidales bacterium]|nr:tRNA (adenosine(37)-N6)-dimethylallyltransferase MiaA [Bacteroidales bacterium]